MQRATVTRLNEGGSVPYFYPESYPPRCRYLRRGRPRADWLSSANVGWGAPATRCRGSRARHQPPTRTEDSS